MLYKRISDFPQEKDDGILSNFVNAINDVGPEGQEFLKTIERSHDVTLFAPCNKALEDDLKLNSILRDKGRFMELLKMHLVVDDRLYINKIVNNNIYKVNNFIHNLFSNLMECGKSIYDICKCITPLDESITHFSSLQHTYLMLCLS